MRKSNRRRKQNQERKRAKKIDSVRKTVQTLNNLSVSIPQALNATKDTEKGLNDAVVVLEDLRDNTFPMLSKVAPFVGGAFVVGSLYILKGIKGEISNG